MAINSWSFLVELNIYSCTVSSQIYGRNKQIVERENKNNWSYGTRVIWKEMENRKLFYFRAEWIRRGMTKGSEEMTVVEKVDQENYSLFFLTLKKENTQKNGKNANSKLKKKPKNKHFQLCSLAEFLDKRCHWLAEVSRIHFFKNWLLTLRNIQNLLKISLPKLPFSFQVYVAIGKKLIFQSYYLITRLHWKGLCQRLVGAERARCFSSPPTRDVFDVSCLLHQIGKFRGARLSS